MALVGLNDKVAAGYLDSGSHYTVISYDMVCKYGLNNLVKPTNATYSVATGLSYRFIGEIPQVTIRFGEVCINVKLQVTSANNYTILLGADVMSTLAIDLLTSSWKIGYRD